MAAASSSLSFTKLLRSILKNQRPVFRASSSALHSIGFSETASLGGTTLRSNFSMTHHVGVAWMVRNRRIWTCPPVYMGRRSSKIATRKGAQDAKKAKRYGRIGKEIVSAVKKGGPNPISNSVLAAVLEKARELDVPKEIVERNIKRASEKGQEAYIEKVYEVYGFGGVSMVVEVLTDKVNRSVAAVREVVKDCGGKMADPGSVLFKFKRARVVTVKLTDVDKDQLLAVALDAGAEDVIEPPVYDDDTDEDHSESVYKVVSSAENYSEILSKFREEGITFEPDNGSELLPLSSIEVDDEAMELNKDLVSKLLELDDVDAVYSDQIIWQVFATHRTRTTSLWHSLILVWADILLCKHPCIYGEDLQYAFHYFM